MTLNIGLGALAADRSQPDCASRGEGKTLSRRHGNHVLPRGETLRDRQDSPAGLQMCMPSASPGCDMAVRRWVGHGTHATLVSEHWRQTARSLTALCTLRENTVMKT